MTSTQLSRRNDSPGDWVCPTDGGPAVSVVGLSGRVPVAEGHAKAFRAGFPPHGPACPAGPCRAHRPGDQVEAFEGGLLGRYVAAGLDRPAVSGVQRLDRVGALAGRRKSPWSSTLLLIYMANYLHGSNPCANDFDLDARHVNLSGPPDVLRRGGNREVCRFPHPW